MKTSIPDISIIIADDHELFRDGLKLMLSKHPEIRIVAEAENGRELVALTLEHKPEVVLTDIKCLLWTALKLQKITAQQPQTGVIGLSMFDEDDLIIDMLEAGAKGYLLKNSDKSEIVDAIVTVYNQDPYYCRNTSRKFTQMIAKSKFNPYSKKKGLNSPTGRRRSST